tara:strand:+ start:285 stop:605 length:321 start_codon:yes stop_codon:yes gene_type:complete
MTIESEGSILSAIVWMFIISILLFWLPVVGPLVAGFVGGMKAGGVGSVILATILPSLVLGVALFFLAALLSGLPIVGFIAAAGGLVLALSQVGLLLVGAIVGGIFS